MHTVVAFLCVFCPLCNGVNGTDEIIMTFRPLGWHFHVCFTSSYILLSTSSQLVSMFSGLLVTPLPVFLISILVLLLFFLSYTLPSFSSSSFTTISFSNSSNLHPHPFLCIYVSPHPYFSILSFHSASLPLTLSSLPFPVSSRPLSLSLPHSPSLDPPCSPPRKRDSPSWCSGG